MGIITIAVDDAVEKRFRRNVQLKYGARKGALGEAITSALESWNADQADLERIMSLLEKSVNRGGYRITDRAQLHERT